MTASSATTTSDASAKFLACLGAADGRFARAAAVRPLCDERLADAVGRAMAQAGCCDLSDRAGRPARDFGTVGAVRTAGRRRRNDASDLHAAGRQRSWPAAPAARRIRALLPRGA